MFTLYVVVWYSVYLNEFTCSVDTDTGLILLLCDHLIGNSNQRQFSNHFIIHSASSLSPRGKLV